MLDHLLIGAIRQELRAAGWRNVSPRTGAPIFTIRRAKHATGDANASDVVWALEYLDGLANGRLG